ncbi:MAG: Crp/Fnr family transcriptional regulator [Sphingomonadales bacterium]|nr:Crp/Fnr family transcriptional regulator [Sphingomonadales bacterium]
MQTFDEMLATSPWARELQPEAMQRVRGAVVVRDITPGCHICHKGDPANVWIGVVDGLVKLVSVSHTGKSVTFAAVPAGSWFGEGSVLKCEARKYDVVALRESRVALMPEATFFWLLDTNIPFNRFIMHQLNERLGQFMAAFEHDRLLSPEARVARTLANMCHPLLYPGHARCIEISQDELGHLVGASRQTVSQALQVLEKAGLIKADYRMLTVVDLEGLRLFGN